MSWDYALSRRGQWLGYLRFHARGYDSQNGQDAESENMGAVGAGLTPTLTPNGPHAEWNTKPRQLKLCIGSVTASGQHLSQRDSLVGQCLEIIVWLDPRSARIRGGGEEKCAWGAARRSTQALKCSISSSKGFFLKAVQCASSLLLSL